MNPNQFKEVHQSFINCVMQSHTSVSDGEQELTHHTLCWRGVCHPGKNLHGNQGGEFLQH